MSGSLYIFFWFFFFLTRKTTRTATPATSTTPPTDKPTISSTFFELFASESFFRLTFSSLSYLSILTVCTAS